MQLLSALISSNKNTGAPLLSGFICAYHRAVPGSNPKDNICPFSCSQKNYNSFIVFKKRENKQKSPGLTHLKTQ